MGEIVERAIDCDVHCEPPSMAALQKYLDPYWLEYVRGGNIRIGHPLPAGPYPPNARVSARPSARQSGTFPPRDYETLREQLLDPYQPERVVLNCISTFHQNRNPYFQVAITKAVNEWLRDEWLDKDPRLRASMVVPAFDPEAAAEEIERLAPDRRFVQVLLPVRSETPWGNRRYRPLHEAASRNGLPIGLHAWGPYGMSPTTTGYARTYFEDYLANSQLVAPTQVLSLVAEGVFDLYPSLRICLIECGFSWLPSLMWRYDKDWKALWREIPWLKAKPSEYISRHFRFTTTPLQVPSHVPTTHVAQLVHMMRAWELLLYSSDYPHDHGDDGMERVMETLGEEGRKAVLFDNATSFYELGL